MTSNKSGGHKVDTQALGTAANDFNKLAEAIEAAVEFAGAGDTTPEHFGRFDAVEDSAKVLLNAKMMLAESLAGLSGFTSQISTKLDQAAGISDTTDAMGSESFQDTQKGVEA